MGVAFGIALRSGIAHTDVEVSIGAELERSAVVPVGNGVERDDFLEGLAGIGFEIGSSNALHDEACEAIALGGVVYDVVFAVLSVVGMEDHAEQAAGAGDNAAGCEECGFGFDGAVLFIEPDFSGLVLYDGEGVGEAGNSPEPGRMLECVLGGIELGQFEGSLQRRDFQRHSMK